MYEELVKRLRERAAWINFPHHGEECPTEDAMLMMQAADAIEELSKRINGVTAERDAAMKRLCEWCGVGCSMENRRAELCEIAAVGLEFLESPKEET